MFTDPRAAQAELNRVKKDAEAVQESEGRAAACREYGDALRALLRSIEESIAFYENRAREIRDKGKRRRQQLQRLQGQLPATRETVAQADADVKRLAELLAERARILEELDGRRDEVASYLADVEEEAALRKKLDLDGDADLEDVYRKAERALAGDEIETQKRNLAKWRSTLSEIEEYLEELRTLHVFNEGGRIAVLWPDGTRETMNGSEVDDRVAQVRTAKEADAKALRNLIATTEKRVSEHEADSERRSAWEAAKERLRCAARHGELAARRPDPSQAAELRRLGALEARLAEIDGQVGAILGRQNRYQEARDLLDHVAWLEEEIERQHRRLAEAQEHEREARSLRHIQNRVRSYLKELCRGRPPRSPTLGDPGPLYPGRLRGTYASEEVRRLLHFGTALADPDLGEDIVKAFEDSVRSGEFIDNATKPLIGFGQGVLDAIDPRSWLEAMELLAYFLFLMDLDPELAEREFKDLLGAQWEAFKAANLSGKLAMLAYLVGSAKGAVLVGRAAAAAGRQVPKLRGKLAELVEKATKLAREVRKAPPPTGASAGAATSRIVRTLVTGNGKILRQTHVRQWLKQAQEAGKLTAAQARYLADKLTDAALDDIAAGGSRLMDRVDDLVKNAPGGWDTVRHLEDLGSTTASRLGQWRDRHLRTALEELRRRGYPGKLTGSATRPIERAQRRILQSDRDITMTGHDAPNGVRALDRYMTERWGKDWRKLFDSQVYPDPGIDLPSRWRRILQADEAAQRTLAGARAASNQIALLRLYQAYQRAGRLDDFVDYLKRTGQVLDPGGALPPGLTGADFTRKLGTLNRQLARARRTGKTSDLEVAMKTYRELLGSIDDAYVTRGGRKLELVNRQALEEGLPRHKVEPRDVVENATENLRAGLGKAGAADPVVGAQDAAKYWDRALRGAESVDDGLLDGLRAPDTGPGARQYADAARRIKEGKNAATTHGVLKELYGTDDVASAAKRFNQDGEWFARQVAENMAGR